METQTQGVYKTFQFYGQTLVLNTLSEFRGRYGYANFCNTGCSLSGRLKQNESLSEWVQRPRESSK